MEIRIGILGYGLVGSELAKILQKDNRFKVMLVGVKNMHDRNSNIFTQDLMSISNDPSIDIIIDALPGIEPSESVIIAAIKNNKTIISCNKELWSMSGNDAIEAAANNNVTIWLNSLVCNPTDKKIFNVDLTDKTIRSFLPEAIYCFRGGGHIDAARFLYKDILKATDLL